MKLYAGITILLIKVVPQVQKMPYGSYLKPLERVLFNDFSNIHDFKVFSTHVTLKFKVN